MGARKLDQTRSADEGRLPEAKRRILKDESTGDSSNGKHASRRKSILEYGPWTNDVAGKQTVVKPLEVSRVQVGPHSWRVTMSDGSTQEEISVKGMVLSGQAKRAKR